MKNNIVGILCCGGLGTRLYPLTLSNNKHLLPVYDKPMVYYPIEALVKADIKDVVVVTGGPYAGNFMRVLKDGKHLGLRHIFYAFQEKEGGIAEAIACAEPYCEDKSVAVILGDNCTDADISKDVRSFKSGAKIFLKKVKELNKFGVPVFKDGKIINIEEKPKEPKSDYAVTGLYLYDHTVFDKIATLSPSARGELEVTDLNNLYIKEDKLEWAELTGYWQDCGSYDSLLEAGNFWKNKK